MNNLELQEYLNKKSEEIHANNVAVGWWDGEQCIFTKMQLISTEIAEATEGVRKDLMDDHLPHRKMEEVELADALIRTLDLGGKMNLSVILDGQPIDTVADLLKAENRTVGFLHLVLNGSLLHFSEELDDEHYSILVAGLISVALVRGYDIISAMEEKLEYNKHRADHKKKNREKEGGKKF